MKTAGQILSPSVLLKQLSALSSLNGISPAEVIQWLRRFDASDKRRRQFEKETGVPAPQAVIFSPTMRCNYNCIGCYSRTHPRDRELSSERINRFFSELEQVGTSVCFISGGEPFMHPDLPDLIAKHPEMLFIVFTNGSLITDELAARLRDSRNIIPALSIDGTEPTVTRRRGPEAWAHIQKASACFRRANMLFGFSTMVTGQTLAEISEPAFFTGLADAGYQLGFVMEYIPVGKDVNRALILNPDERTLLRKAVLTARKRNPFQLFQLPEDTDDGESCGAARRFMHINAEGGLEPCPFCHHFDCSIRDQSFQQALQSPLFKRIRATPELFDKKELNCALAENADRVASLVS